MSEKNKLDQYYTKPEIAKYFSKLIVDRYPDGMFVEPSAGHGSFSLNFTNIISYDLEPKFEECIEQDFLQSDLTSHENCVYVGNPPFGKNSSLALKFINKCMWNARAVCFILPRTFKKVLFQERVNLNYSVVYEEDVAKNSFLLEGKEYDVPCVFQIWEKNAEQRVRFIPKNPSLQEVSPEDADLCVRRVGGKAGKILDGMDHSPSSTFFFKDTEGKIREKILLLEEVLVEESKNTAGVRSISKREIEYYLNFP